MATIDYGLKAHKGNLSSDTASRSTELNTIDLSFIGVSTVLSEQVYTPEQVREKEPMIAKLADISLYQLMERAGASVFNFIHNLVRHNIQHPKLLVVCGKGNNAGDGYIVATIALQQGWDVTLAIMPECEQVSGDAHTAQTAFLAQGGQIETIEHVLSVRARYNIIIDAILGTGVNKHLTDDWIQAIQSLNAYQAIKVAVDVPSGLNAASGAVWGEAFKAEYTVCFMAIKSGLVTGKGKDYTGKLLFASLGVSRLFEQHVPAYYKLSQWSRLKSNLKPREKSAYKNQFGNVVCIGGDKGMSGAIRMTAESCLRAGAGLVTVLTHTDNALAVSHHMPEIMVYGVNGVDSHIKQILDNASVIVAGPGMGKTGWSNGLMQVVSELNKPMVIDADGLNWLADNPVKNSHWVLTPHSGEAARLLNQSSTSIELDRYAASFELSARYGGIVVLKGAGSIISSSKKTTICRLGNPGMATAGMGDVLAGVVASMLAQKNALDIDHYTAAELAVNIHAIAGDKAAIDGERGMIASDLIKHIRSVVNLT